MTIQRSREKRRALTQVYFCLLVVQSALLRSVIRGDCEARGDLSAGTVTRGCSSPPHDQHRASVESLLTADLECKAG